MFNLISLIIGVVALPCLLVAFMPFLGWANWFVVPLGIVGLAFGLLSSGRTGRNLNLLVILIGVVRLSMGHGII